MRKSLQKTAIALAIITSFGLTGCFDGKPAASLETSSLNKTTTGVITGFGSVFVNGVEYETTNANVNIDGVENAQGGDAGLKLGMVVSLSGDATGANGNAVSISFNDEVEGMVTTLPVSNGTGGYTLTVMGLTINMDEDTVFENAVDGTLAISDIVIGNIVEVSGYSAGDGTVWATRVEMKSNARADGDTVELKGVIRDLSADGSTFTIGAMVLSITNAVLAENEITTLSDGMLIETKSDVALDGNGVMIVTEIDVKSEMKKRVETDGNDEEVEVEGVITAGITNSAFDVNGSTVIFDANTRFVHGAEANIATGVKIKVKGVVDTNGDFLAETIVFKPTGDIKLAGAITSADAATNTVSIFGLTINLVNSTFVEDDRDVAEDDLVKYLFGADDLVAGDWLEIKAYKNSNGELVAMKMIRTTPDTTPVSVLKGKVDSTDLTLVSGVTVDFSSSNISPLPIAGDRVELEGTFDVNTGIFSATSGEASSGPDENYIGAEDAEENKKDERRH